MHPSLFPFLSSERWLSYLKHALQFGEDDLEVARLLLEKKLIPVVRGPELGHFLGVSPKIVALMAARTQRFYNSFKVAKKSGGTRTISAPRVFLKQTQRYILDCILSELPLPSPVVGFRKSISIVDGARPHLKNRFLWNIDIKNFFPSISKSLVVEEFKRIGYPDRAAAFLANICTLNGELPQGAPTSPTLANLVFLPIDMEISALCDESGIAYTRYADDLSFSSSIVIPEGFQRSVRQLISASSFKLNAKKERLVGPMGRREVTGVVINEQISIPRKRRREIRAMFHKAKFETFLADDRMSQLEGYLGWVTAFHPDEARQYREILDSKKMGTGISAATAG
jgi:RNA-directed DNA polymerase